MIRMIPKTFPKKSYRNEHVALVPCRCAVIASLIALVCANGYGQYVSTGPAAGGGLEAYVPPDAGTTLTAAEFRKLDCDPGETRVGRDTYYTCGGRTYKKDMVCGRRAYILVSGIPY